VLSFSVPTGAYSNVYKSNRSAGKRIALTFDDGPHPIFTGRILDILERYNVKATFFVVGQNVENYPKAFERLVSSECEIGNHTYTHKNIGNMSEDELLMELERTERAIERISHRHTLLLRPPEGHFGDVVQRVSVVRGYDIILWSIDTLDWAHTSAADMAKKVISNVSCGDIILMHDYTSGGAHTIEALEIIIPRLIEMGYELVTVSELICDE
jgi:peptidoglycan/xylan/chitin deacetylase (PgdA/CDA1 family)